MNIVCQTKKIFFYRPNFFTNLNTYNYSSTVNFTTSSLKKNTKDKVLHPSDFVFTESFAQLNATSRNHFLQSSLSEALISAVNEDGKTQFKSHRAPVICFNHSALATCKAQRLKVCKITKKLKIYSFSIEWKSCFFVSYNF